MKKRIPIRLKKEPLIEVVWEIRFATTEPSAVDVLPGLLFSKLAKKYPHIVRLPSADIPKYVVENEPAFKYTPKIRLEGENQAIFIGDHVLSLNRRRPYSGWKIFSEDIKILIKIINDTGLIKKLERFSLKYVDLINLDSLSSLSYLNLELKLGGYDLDKRPVKIHTVLNEGGLSHIIQIISPAEVTIPGETVRSKGVLVDIDTIKELKETETLSDVENYLELVHDSSKEIFFSLLTEETLEKLEPEYEDT